MIFSNKRSYISTTNNTNHPRSQMSYTSTQKTKDSIMPLIRHVPKNVAVVRSTTYVEKVETQNESKKIKWGEPFWNLFHVLAEKVKESEFHRIRVDFLNFIYLICSNLPCPDCTTHAVHYLNGINFNAITTKEELKNMLFNFHNSVNARKGYPLFPRCELDNKYRGGNTSLIIDTFLLHFKSRPYSVRLFTDTLHRERVMKNIISWFEKNITCFL